MTCVNGVPSAPFALMLLFLYEPTIPLLAWLTPVPLPVTVEFPMMIPAPGPVARTPNPLLFKASIRSITIVMGECLHHLGEAVAATTLDFLSNFEMQRGARPEKLKQEMAKDGTLSNLYVQMREQKALDKVLETAKIEDVDLPPEGAAAESKA